MVGSKVDCNSFRLVLVFFRMLVRGGFIISEVFIVFIFFVRFIIIGFFFIIFVMFCFVWIFGLFFFSFFIFFCSLDSFLVRDIIVDCWEFIVFLIFFFMFFIVLEVVVLFLVIVCLRLVIFDDSVRYFWLFFDSWLRVFFSCFFIFENFFCILDMIFLYCFFMDIILFWFNFILWFRWLICLLVFRV